MMLKPRPRKAPLEARARLKPSKSPGNVGGSRLFSNESGLLRRYEVDCTPSASQQPQ